MFLNTIIKNLSSINLREFISAEKKHRECFFLMREKLEKIQQTVFVLGYSVDILNQLYSSDCKNIIILETDLGVLKGVCKQVHSLKNVSFYYVDHEDFSFLQHINPFENFREYSFICHRELQNSRIQKRVENVLEEYFLSHYLSLSDISDLGQSVFTNVLKNMQKLAFCKNGTSLKEAFSKIPAVVCGAGNSLNDVIDDLEDFQNKGIIFAGGSVLNILARRSIAPHISAALDPKAFLQEFCAFSQGHIPMCIQMRVNPQNVSDFSEKVLGFGESDQAVFSHLLQSLYSVDSFSSGWCVGNFLAHIAAFSGCSPIYYSGMDFSYTKGKKYADEQEGIREKNKVQKDFVLAKKYMERLCKKYPNTEFIDLSKKKKTSQAYKRFYSLCDRSDLDGMVYQTLSCANKIYFDQKSIEKLYESFHKASIFFAKLPSNDEKIEKDLGIKMAYEYILAPIWKFYKPLFENKLVFETLSNKEKNMQIHKSIFFQRVIGIYVELINKVCYASKKV